MKTFLLNSIFLFLSLASFCQGQYTWTEKANIPAIARHRSVALAIGQRGYFGTGHYNVGFETDFADWWEYDPTTNSWTQKADFGGGQRLHATGFVINNKGYVGLGRDPNYADPSDFWEYDPTTNVWTQVAPFPGPGREGAVSFALSKFGYVATGSYYNDLWQYDPTANAWTQKTPMPTSGRWAAVGFAIGDKGYVGTGDLLGSSSDFWEYNPNIDQWTQKANVPGLPREEACGFSMSGKGYIGSGDNYQGGDGYPDFYAFDPDSNTWTQVADFPGAVRRYMVAFAIGDHAYGGSGTSGINYSDWWCFGNNYVEPEPLDTFVSTGISEVKNEFSINISPNPFTEYATVQIQGSSSNEDFQFSIYDLGGKEIRTVNSASSNEITVQRDDLPSGIYLYRAYSNGRIISTGKLVAI